MMQLVPAKRVVGEGSTPEVHFGDAAIESVDEVPHEGPVDISHPGLHVVGAQEHLVVLLVVAAHVNNSGEREHIF